MRSESLLHIAQEEFQAYASHCCFYRSFSPWSFANVLFSSTPTATLQPHPSHHPPYAVTPESVAVREATVFTKSHSCGCLYHTILKTLSIYVAQVSRTKWRDRPRRSEAESSQAEPARLNVKFTVLTLSSDVCLPDHCANLEDACGHDLRQAESCMIGVPVVQQKRVCGAVDALALSTPFWFSQHTHLGNELKIRAGFLYHLQGHIMYFQATVGINGLLLFLIVNQDLVLEPPLLRYAHHANVVDVVIARPLRVHGDSGLSSIISIPAVLSLRYLSKAYKALCRM